MPTNFRYIKVPDNCINESQFFSDIKEVIEHCSCGAEFWPGKWYHDSAVFTDDFRNWLESYNCFIFRAEAFLVSAGHALVWHIDSNDNPDLRDLAPNLNSKINFMWGGDLTKCYMEYGGLKERGKGLIITRNPRGRLIHEYDPERMKVDERFSLEHTVLVNRGVPHRVSNESDDNWICLSCVIQASDTGKPLKFADALERFKSVCVG
jgi:hypothetical protein